VAIRQTITGLVQWGINPGINTSPANYTHRQILVGLKLLGANRLLGTILDEVKEQSELGNGPAIIDVASALVCAPDAMSWDSTSGISMLSDGQSVTPLQRRMTLREALKIEAENAPKTHKTDVPLAEAVIRLHRRVEAQMAQMTVQEQPLMAHAGMDGLDVTALDGLDGAMGGGIGEGGHSIDDVMNGETDFGLMGGADGMDTTDMFDGIGDAMSF
jgi:mediator of RNA polymerase II transcription subunit 5